jgi:hypothetical protein
MRIPTVAGATLVLGGGCGDDASVEGIAARWCAFLRQCEPEEFASYYDSLSDCEIAYGFAFAYYEREYTRAYGPECGAAFLALYDCYLDYHEASGMCFDGYDYDDEPPPGCAAEYAAFERACPYSYDED